MEGHADVPTFYTYEEGLSHLTSEGQATLQRLEGMLAQSVADQFHMAGVRTDDPQAGFEGQSTGAAGIKKGGFLCNH